MVFNPGQVEFERREPKAYILGFVDVTEKKNSYIIDIYTTNCALVDYALALAYVPVRLLTLNLS